MANFEVGLPADYKWVGLVVLILNLECFFLGFIYINMKRGKTFTLEFMKTHFTDLVEDAFRTAPRKGGYPDTGNGWHATKLEYLPWLDFNTAQRSHLNFVENLPAMTFLTMFAGLFYPLTAMAIGIGLIASRTVYIVGYFFDNPASRFFGFIPMMALNMAQIGLCVAGIVKVF